MLLIISNDVQIYPFLLVQAGHPQMLLNTSGRPQMLGNTGGHPKKHHPPSGFWQHMLDSYTRLSRSFQLLSNVFAEVGSAFGEISSALQNRSHHENWTDVDLWGAKELEHHLLHSSSDEYFLDYFMFGDVNSIVENWIELDGAFCFNDFLFIIAWSDS